MTEHKLKLLPQYFSAVQDGTKTFEIREDDRGFLIGDILQLEEFSPEIGYTGKHLRRKVSYITDYEQKDGYVVLGLVAEESSLLDKAIIIATKAHSGQVDKGGHPYILHPLTLMLQMPTEELKIIAVLHDVIEDTYVTLDDLRAEGMPERVLEALDAITRRAGEKKKEYLRRVAMDPFAIRVKMEDLEHNMDISRLGKLSMKDLERRKIYGEQLTFLKKKQQELYKKMDIS